MDEQQKQDGDSSAPLRSAQNDSSDDLTANSHQLKAEEYLAGWKRAQADYQNLKKETDRDRAEYTKYANERLLHEVLPAIDQFALAMQHAPVLNGLEEGERKVWENWLTGLRAVQSLWNQMAGSIGLERIPTNGAFDPSLHDAAGEEEAEGKEAGSIVKVMQDGWRLHGKVLRPARVIIAKS
ncbi:nucleotide exchange factor GrpE [Candidatus Uhrbacteria bacterium]|nr:nucleotide exchange factor GrpE [Candidatus Uhrbacteria bacterium]